MGLKIKKVNISGLRGVKDSLTLDLNQRSILIYGENGTGKSSITDSLEWFFTDCVSHLSSSEIEMREAIRNSNIEESTSSELCIEFSRTNLDSKKEMHYKRGKLTCQFSNKSAEFESYLKSSERENFLLRYQFLRDFIDQTKGDKLKHLSDIIGFTSVTKTKDVLKKTLNSLKSEIKTQNFETLISTQKQTLVEKIGAAVSQEENLFERINEVVGGLGIDIVVRSMPDLELLLNKLKSPASNSLTRGYLKNTVAT